MKSQQKESDKISKLSLNVTLNQNIESFENQNPEHSLKIVQRFIVREISEQ